ncbi:uncharacterized protein LOC130737008 [Lotus japonicus]|uniref:uncharacterized protein LOC130737008 n=1 Tax=Lotus japonicus TaxID=34305 RepID=UPI00258DDBDB|nr:uncharacterized protein LOC130737008 [Lotus japonicus]
MVNRSGANGRDNHVNHENVPPDILQQIMADLTDLRQHNQQLQTQLAEINQDRGLHEGDRRMAEMVVDFQPFTEDIANTTVPDNLKTLVLDSYYGDSDPKDHLVYFNTKMRHNESLQSFMGRFNQLSVHLEDKMPEICIAAFELGLQSRSLNSSLSRKPVETMAELRSRVQGFIREEQSDRIKRNRKSAAVVGQQQQSDSKKAAVNDQRSGGAPHEDDPIVVMLKVADYEIERVLLDQGSSADLIYGDAFEKLGLTETDLLPYDGALVGFSGEKVFVRGYVELNTVFGEGKNEKAFSIKFLVVQCTSPYNVLIGRPSLNKLGAIISTRHLTVKYPLDKGGVGTLKADQVVARKCYSDSFKQYGHMGKRAVKEGHRVFGVDVDEEEVSLDPREGFSDFKMTPEEETKTVKVGERNLKVGVNLTQIQESRLVQLLAENMDLFSWSARDLPGIDPEFICHKLALNPGMKPIAQLKRKMGEEKALAVKTETNKLIDAGFIREVKYPTWLANVVMVKKSNGKWRMCTYYTDLNKHCPKDSYPLPNIDKLVDRASGFGMLSLMDAYSGYHQIRMYAPDEEKTAFMINQANYCYQTMSFGLKNAGATYQRLMDRVFEKQVGRNMEIFVDDMVVKSEEMGGHCMDLAEAFGEIRKHNMRLNPEKCSFGIQSGKFLGFMITRKGIEVNPDKCKAILEMQSPTSVKEVQKLTGRIAALSRFLPCSGSKAAPFFQCLRKNKAFQWTDECEQAFQTLKEHLAKPPILSKPIPEKAALALIITTRKLRPYFQGFQIKVKTDFPLRQVLQKPDLAGRMVSWAVELSEFGIVFEKKGQIKAQGLIDFVNEMSPEEKVPEEVEWFLSVDGSSNLKGSGAGIVLEGPGGVIIEQSLKFDFKASNNQAEYEAIIAGVRLALEMNVRCIVIKTDSQLVANQIKGDYQAKDVQLAKYLVKVQELLK